VNKFVVVMDEASDVDEEVTAAIFSIKVLRAQETSCSNTLVVFSQLLTPWSRVLEKSVVTLLVKKFSAF